MKNFDLPFFQNWVQGLHILPSSPCSYYSEKISQVKAFLSDQALPNDVMEFLFQQGFRRSGNLFYQNHCPDCNLCLGVRLFTDNFALSKSQKRILRKNQDITFQVVKPKSTKLKKNIYLRYQYIKHYKNPPKENPRDGDFDIYDSLMIMQEQMYENIFNSLEVEIWHNKKLVGFAIIDVGRTSVSMVYLVFEPSYYKQSPGKFIILKTLEWVKKNGFQKLYIGFFIPGHSKMDYKKEFQPAQILDPKSRQWLNFSNFHKIIKAH